MSNSVNRQAVATKVLRNVEMKWVKLARPVGNPFDSSMAFEMAIVTTDAAQAAEWTDADLNVKQVGDEYRVNLKRYATSKDGKRVNKVPILDQNKEETIDAASIGNGSLGAVKVFQYPYARGGRTGIATQISAVQISELVEYKPSEFVSEDF